MPSTNSESVAGESTAHRFGRLVPALAVTMVALAAAIHFFAFISDYAVNVLFYDQWDFLSPLFGSHASLGQLFFYQHGPHREGLGLIADSLLYPSTDWNTRAESFLIGGCVFAAMVLTVLLKYRLFGKLSYGDAAIPLIFLTLAQYETFIGTPNAAYSGIPLLLIVLYCHALLARRYQIRYALCLGLNFLLIYTGFGLFMGVVTIGAFALECYWRLRKDSEIPLGASLAALLIAGLSLGSFFLRYRFEPAVDCFVFPDPHPLAYPMFAAVMAARFSGPVLPLRLAVLAGSFVIACAAVVVAVLARRLVLIRGKRPEGVDLVAGILLAYSALFVVNTAIGRVCVGLYAAQAPRYVTLLIPGVTGCYFFLQTLLQAGVRRVLTMTFILLLLPGSVVVDDGADWFADGKRAWVECYLQIENIKACDQSAGFVNHPYPDQAGMKEKLDYLKEHRLNLFSSR